MTKPISSQIPGPAGMIEVTTISCDFNLPLPALALLVMHPHPLHGGSKDNKVVTTIAHAGRDEGLAVVTFNFRGVGKSQGRWDNGIGELDDAVSVASTMIESGVSELILAGFSFGASVAANLIPKIKEAYPNVTIRDLILVAPALERYPIELDTTENFPRIVCVNDDDDVVNPDIVVKYAMNAKADVATNPTGGHYFHGQLVWLKKTILLRWRDLGFR